MPTDLPAGLFFDLVKPEDVEASFEIEKQVFPPEEAATLQALRFRQSNAPSLFLGAFQPPRTLIGYIVSTLSSASSLSHESMSKHIPGGSSVCIHSVSVMPPFWRRGIALALLKEYVERVKQRTDDLSHVDRLLLISHEEICGLYTKAGFEMVGKSPVVHGNRDWFEMRLILPPKSPECQPLIISQEEMAAALSSRLRGRATGLTTASVGGLSNIVVHVGDDLEANKYKIVCLRDGCGSVMLLPRAAQLKQGPSLELEPVEFPPPAPLPSLPPPGSQTSWWLVTPSPMAFENIGFSRPVVSSTSDGGPGLKLLSCAECDLGPVGWSLEGGREFWVHSERVGYTLD